MDPWLIAVLYVAGLALITAEAFLPGLVMGLVGAACLGTSIVFGFRVHWGLGLGQIALAVIVGPLALITGLKRMTLKSSLDTGATFAADYAAWSGKEGEAATDLRPAGTVLVDGKRVDVVTAGELIARGSKVKVVKVEGNRVVVKAIA
jgi:membrane-bound serine protease (ClpP class)